MIFSITTNLFELFNNIFLLEIIRYIAKIWIVSLKFICFYTILIIYTIIKTIKIYEFFTKVINQLMLVIRNTNRLFCNQIFKYY